MLLQDAQDGAAGGAEDALRDARCARSHGARVLAPQLLDKLRELRAQLGAVAAARHPLCAQPSGLPRACHTMPDCLRNSGSLAKQEMTSVKICCLRVVLILYILIRVKATVLILWV